MSAPSSASATEVSTNPSPAVMSTYGRINIVFERGEGSWLIATNGERYLDFGSGIAVNSLGHAHPKLVAALTEQAKMLWHTSNLYRIKGQERLAERLCAASFADTIFFCNSGAEACEGAIKAARRYHYVTGAAHRTRVLTFEGCFHGRTLATIAAAKNPKHLEGFGPEAPGFDQIAVTDLDAVRAAVTDETAAIMIEPIQGEGGIRAISNEFLQGLRSICDEQSILLVIDEVQTGIGRTGKLFAHEWAGIKPDIVAVAKGIGGGFPLGAVLATNEAAKGMAPGTHGSTFGGNPLAVAVGNAVVEELLSPGFLDAIQEKAKYFKEKLDSLKAHHSDAIEEVRGYGLLVGLRLKPAVGDVIGACMDQHLLGVVAGDNVMRLIPPLNVSKEELDEAVNRLSKALEQVAAA